LKRTGKHEDALAAYRKAIELAPDNARAHLALGALLRQTGRLDESIAALRQAIRLNPLLEGAFTELGDALAEKGRLDEAIACYRKALQTDPPDRVEPLLGLGKALASKQQYTAAARSYARAFVVAPKRADDLLAGQRSRAAEVAARAGCGQGKDASKVEKERARLRGQALRWLRADLDGWSKRLASGKAEDAAGAAKRLRQWQASPALACVRDREALAKLPEPERADWRKFWEDVEALRSKSAKGK
jgi:tetratricopeptide (TPR) repeat protein